MKKKILIFLVLLLLPNFVLGATDLAQNLSGRILLQVEENGEAWYVSPQTLKRHFLARPNDAFSIMQDLGIGITDSDLDKIPIGFISTSGSDSDGDGLIDNLEKAIGTDINKKDSDNDGHSDKQELEDGYNPSGAGKLPLNLHFTERNVGKIFLQVEKNGEAWYLDPVSKKRYFLARPQDAFNVMREFGLGITNNNLSQIEIKSGEVEEVVVVPNVSVMEQKIHDSINNERAKEGLSKLLWNDEIAQVARRHAEDLADENINLVTQDKLCSYVLIHHEGKEFGIYQTERLQNSNINYFVANGENIVLMPTAYYNFLVDSLASCSANNSELRNDFDSAMAEAKTTNDKIAVINNEIKKREDIMAREKKYSLVSIEKIGDDEVVKDTVEGWMGSEGHRANILNRGFDEAGIGVSFFEGYMIAVQVFIERG